MSGDSVGGLDAGQRAALMLLVAAVPVLFWPRTINAFQLPKLTLLVLLVAAILVLEVARVAVTGKVEVPRSPVVYLAGAFATAVLVAALTSEQIATSIIGQQTRLAGALMYLSCVVVFIALLRLFNLGSVDRLMSASLVAFAAVGSYGLLQLLDVDPLTWQGGYSLVATLGNPNLAAAALAIGTPIAASRVVGSGRSLRARVAYGVLASALLGISAATDSLQGPIAAAAGLGVLLLAVALNQPDRLRRLWVTVLCGGAGAGALVIAAGLSGIGPLSRMREQGTVTLRTYYWDAAASMFAENPLTGVGLSMYGRNFRLHRSFEAATDLATGGAVADAAHSVPLSMFAEGGLLLGLTYVGFVIVVGLVLVRGLLRLEGQHRLLLGGVGGAWTAYQVQSLVSFDVPPLAMLHWVLAGAVVVIADPPVLHTWSMPWAPRTRAARRRSARNQSRAKQQVALVLAGIVLLGLTVVATRPIRADIAAFYAGRSATVDQALGRINRATDLAPWESNYWYIKGRVYISANDAVRAQEALAEAVRRDPSSVPALEVRARLAVQQGEIDLARSHYERLLQVEAQAPGPKAEVAEFELQYDNPRRAIELLESAVAASGGQPAWWVILGDARAATDDDDGARSAYLHALELDPTIASAQEGLERVGR